jgi:hypothetical protein
MKKSPLATVVVTLMLIATANAQDVKKHYCLLGFGEFNNDGESKGSNDKFEVPIKEWERTTKSYKLPGTNLFVVASVTYSENNSLTRPGPESSILELQVSEKPERDHLKSLASAVVETKFDSEKTSFLQLFYRVKGQLFHIGFQCSRKER